MVATNRVHHPLHSRIRTRPPTAAVPWHHTAKNTAPASNANPAKDNHRAVPYENTTARSASACASAGAGDAGFDIDGCPTLNTNAPCTGWVSEEVTCQSTV